MAVTLRATDNSQSDLIINIGQYIQTISEKAKKAEIKSETLLMDELFLDSLDLVRVIMHLEDQYKVAIDLDEVPDMKRVGDLAATVTRYLKAAA